MLVFSVALLCFLFALFLGGGASLLLSLKFNISPAYSVLLATAHRSRWGRLLGRPESPVMFPGRNRGARKTSAWHVDYRRLLVQANNPIPSSTPQNTRIGDNNNNNIIQNSLIILFYSAGRKRYAEKKLWSVCFI